MDLPDLNETEIFSIIRQWTPGVQKNLRLLIELLIKFGFNIVDRTNDMTIPMYIVRSGGFEDGEDESVRLLNVFLQRASSQSRKIDLRYVSKSLQACCIHLAAIYDCPELIELIIRKENKGIDDRCGMFGIGGTALHLAAASLSIRACEALLRLGANDQILSSNGLLAKDCIGALMDYDYDITSQIKTLFYQYERMKVHENIRSSTKTIFHESADKILSTVKPSTSDVQVNDIVQLSMNRSGVVRYIGCTKFAKGIWAGVELNNKDGKNDGSVAGVQYFKCPMRKGVFVSEESRVDSNGSLHSAFHYNKSAAQAELYILQDKYINESSFNDQHVPNSDNNEEPLLKRSERNKKPPKYLDDYEWGRGECCDIG
ncbi:hypothetical protein GJ496_002373 [Pomphorhynchus laevis]|nr:hypothetical protein GJ496_002373 [Pomphorhynchus laevis]